MAKETRFAPAPAPGAVDDSKRGSVAGPKRPDIARPDSRNLLKRMKRVGLQEGTDAILRKVNQ